MKILLFFCIFPFLSLAVFDPTFGNTSYPKYNETAFEADVISFQEEAHATKFFKPLIEENAVIGRRVVLQTIRKGWWSISEYLIKNYYNPNKIDLYMTFLEARKKFPPNNLGHFEKLVFLLPIDSIFLNIIKPCYLWAQDMNQIFLKVKFSPKIDVPGFMEVFRINVTGTSYEIMLSGVSLDGDLPVKFELDLKTYKNMETHPGALKWIRTEMGTIEITVIKAPRPYFWKNLLEDMFNDPPNQYLWWDMLYEKRAEIEQALILFDSRENQREDIDEVKLNNEDKRIVDLRYLKERAKHDEERILKDLRNRGYCWNIGYEEKCLVANPLDWHAWFFD